MRVTHVESRRRARPVCKQWALCFDALRSRPDDWYRHLRIVCMDTETRGRAHRFMLFHPLPDDEKMEDLSIPAWILTFTGGSLSLVTVRAGHTPFGIALSTSDFEHPPTPGDLHWMSMASGQRDTTLRLYLDASIVVPYLVRRAPLQDIHAMVRYLRRQEQFAFPAQPLPRPLPSVGAFIQQVLDTMRQCTPPEEPWVEEYSAWCSLVATFDAAAFDAALKFPPYRSRYPQQWGFR